MTGPEEIDALLSKAVDGELTEAERLHLGALLRDDPACQEAYVDYLLLDSLLHWEKPVVANAARRPLFARPIVRWALAACLLLATGTGLVMMTWPEPAEAEPALVDRLVEWNLTITSAPSDAEREKEYRTGSSEFTRELATAKVPPDERPLAIALLEDARTLAATDQPLESAEQLDRMSEKLLAWIGSNPQLDPKRAKAMEQHYLRLVERSLGQLKRAKTAAQAAKADEAFQKRIERLNERIAARAAARAAREAEKALKQAEKAQKKKSR